MESFLLRVCLPREDFSWEGIDINAAVLQDFDAMMPIDHRPVWPYLQ